MMQKAKVKLPTLAEERKLWRKGYDFVAGLDEVGRGPLAGPVVACAVCLTRKSSFSVIPAPHQVRGKLEAGIQVFCRPELVSEPGFRVKPARHRYAQALAGGPGMTTINNIRDSKRLSQKQREQWYKLLVRHSNIKWGIGLVSEKIIDRINILAATKLAMKKALEDLEKKGVQAEYLLLDGNFLLEGLSLSQKAVTRGDAKIWSCAAASIIAKVTRDRMMVKYHQKYQQYG
ncbi:ribonuclease HII, partial [Patescibacteria group bacterium]|nr:ribonuclease HII [Patescibacteria group bacterium]